MYHFPAFLIKSAIIINNAVSVEYKELMPIMARNRERLEKDFTPEQAEWLAKYDDVINEMHSIVEVEAFKYSFPLAINLTLESISEK